MPSRSSRSRPASRTSSSEPTGSASLTAIAGMLTARLDGPDRPGARAYRLSMAADALLAEQIRYSRQRAPEYDEFWALVRAALAPDGRVFLVDSHRGDGAHTVPGGPDVEVRRLLDGREFRIVKRYYEPRALEERLAALGRRLTVATTAGGSLLY